MSKIPSGQRQDEKKAMEREKKQSGMRNQVGLFRMSSAVNVKYVP